MVYERTKANSLAGEKDDENAPVMLENAAIVSCLAGDEAMVRRCVGKQ